MSDFSRSFNPWQNGFSQGLYLAGVECNNDADAPEGWTNISLVGAVHDFNCPETGKGYMLFPIRKL